MPYAATVSVTRTAPGKWVARIDEIDCAVGDEATIDGVPLVGEVRRQICLLRSGTAVTVQPILGEVPDPVTNIDRIVVREAVAAAEVDTAGSATYYDASKVPAGVFDADGNQIQGARLYHRSRPNAGADNVVTTIYHISADW